MTQTHLQVVHVLVKSENFDPLRDWMPWIIWDGSWLESYPLQTEFKIPIQMVDMTVRVLMKRGFMPKQSRLAARM